MLCIKFSLGTLSCLPEGTRRVPEGVLDPVPEGVLDPVPEGARDPVPRPRTAVGPRAPVSES